MNTNLKIPELDKPYFYNNVRLPRSWIIAKISDVCNKIIGGGTPSRTISNNFNGSIIWLTPTEIPKNKIIVLTSSKEKITIEGLKNSSATLIPKGSVLLTSRASIGYVGI